MPEEVGVAAQEDQTFGESGLDVPPEGSEQDQCEIEKKLLHVDYAIAVLNE